MFASSSAPVDAPARGAFVSSMTREHGFLPLRVEGALPPELRGTLYRVGPGLLESFARPYDHIFEGDGAVCALRFGVDGVRGAHRLVLGEALQGEHRRGRPEFGSVAPWRRRARNGLQRRFKNAANTNLMLWQGHLYALFEVCPPTELSLELTTRGETSLGVDVHAFSAHPHAVARRGAQYNFGVRYGRAPQLDVFELPDRGPARVLTTLPLAAPVMLHDFIATDRHLVFFVSPARVVAWRALLGVNPFDQMFAWTPSAGTEVIVIPIDAPDDARRFSVDPFFQWHFAGAFERGDELLVDLVVYPDLQTLPELRRGQVARGGTLTRARVDLARARLTLEPLADLECEFPRADPRVAGGRHRRLWLCQDFDAHDRRGLLQIDIDERVTATRAWSLSPWERPSEPVFVPRSASAPEGDGWVLSLVHDARARKSHVVVLDTARFEDGPIARAHFDHHVPMTFHGLWVPADP